MVGTDPRTLSADRLAHMQAFQNYRISWEEVAQTAGRKLSLAAAPADGASAPRPRAEWMSAIISELQRLNDRVSELRRGGRRNENELERVRSCMRMPIPRSWCTASATNPFWGGAPSIRPCCVVSWRSASTT